MRSRDELIAEDNRLRSESYGIEKCIRRRHKMVRCPHNCFEQEPGNGAFEKVSHCGWGVEECSVCGGLGWVTEEAANHYHKKFGVWRKERVKAVG